MFAQLTVEEFDLSHLDLVQVDLHLAGQFKGAAEDGDGLNLGAADVVGQFGQFFDMSDQLIQSFLVAHK